MNDGVEAVFCVLFVAIALNSCGACHAAKSIDERLERLEQRSHTADAG